MNPNKITVKDRVKELRGRQSQGDFAKKFGVVSVTISQIETGKQNPSWELALKICEEFSCSMDWLQGRSEIKNLQIVPQEDFREKYYEILEKNNVLQERIIQLQDAMLQNSFDKSVGKGVEVELVQV